MRAKILIITILFFQILNLQAQSEKVFLMEIKAPIDPRTNRYTQLAIEEAKSKKVDLIIVEMNTYGGAVTDADEIRQRFLDLEIPIYVFINKNAASAGALISIACDSIYMTEGANIGAATVVNGDDGAKAPDKYQSYMRSMMRSTAEAKGRNPQIAEAMVDENLEVDSVSQVGQVITFTTSEAIENGFCDAQLESIDKLLKRLSLEDHELIKYEEDWAEDVIQFFLNPAISGILILIMMGGIYFELQSPGIGFPIAAAFLASLLYFTPHYMHGLAENWEIIMFFVGVILIGLEVFVIPGFGIAGVFGVLFVFASLFLVMINNVSFDFTYVDPSEINKALIVIAFSMIGAMGFAYFGAKLFMNSKAFSRIALGNTMSKEDGFVSNSGNDMIGEMGVSYSVLRPSGKVMIDNQLHDAETRGGYLEKGVDIVVIGSDTSSLVVKKA